MESRYAGWPADAVALVERACDAHGGRDRWLAVDRVSLAPLSLSGFLSWLKGHKRTFRLPRRFETRPHARTTLFHDYPDEDHEGTFEDGDVRIVARAGGGVVAQGRNHRATFRGLGRYRRWRPLDALYFFGYAMWHYHTLPFSLGDARFLRLVRASDRGQPLSGVDVELPPDIHTHSRRQSFFFDERGRIRRHDYTAEVAGSWARGCHFWDGYVEAGGLIVATRRRVHARLFGRPTPLVALDAHLADARVE